MRFTTSTGCICLGIFVLFKNPHNWKALTGIACVGLLINFAGSLNSLGVTKSYNLSSNIPAVIIYFFCLYVTIKKVHPNVRMCIRYGFLTIFTFAFSGMMYYQYCEITHTLSHSDFQHIFLPRLMYIILFAQIAFLAIATHIPCLVWSVKETSKMHRIYAFFVFLGLSVFPMLLTLAGEGQQIIFLIMYLIAVVVNYSFKEIGESNCILQYCFYSLIMQVMFQNTNHVLDFNAPRIHRAFVGFPIFNDYFTYTIGFFETTSVYTFFMILVPILTIESYPSYSQKQCLPMKISKNLYILLPQV